MCGGSAWYSCVWVFPEFNVSGLADCAVHGSCRKSADWSIDFGKTPLNFKDRLFRCDDGRRLRFKVEGRGNSRKDAVEIA